MDDTMPGILFLCFWLFLIISSSMLIGVVIGRHLPAKKKP